MAPTMKHRRSKSKRNSTRGADRYDKVLTKFKKIKRLGGSITKVENNQKVLPHRVSKKNPEYKGVKVITKESKK